MQQLTRRNLLHWSSRAQPPIMHLVLSAIVADVTPLKLDNSDGVTRSGEIPAVDDT